MSSELVVDVQPKEISIALLENNRLVELQKEARNISFSVGDIYLGRVKKLMPGLNAAFVDVGYEKDAFLHYLDLGTQYNSSAKFLKQSLADRKRVLSLSKFDLLPDIEKDGTINDALKVGQEVLVQIAKEPISSKGPRLTAEISFAGRFLVLIPFSDKVSVSQKIKSNEEKLRLRQLIQSIKPRNFGVIVRTVAEGKRVAELNNELKTLVRCWEDMLVKLQKAQLPSLVYEETGRTVGILRDIFSPSFENIYVNDKETYNQIYNYVSLISPDRKDIVKLYDGELPIFDNFAITKQIKSSLGKTVSFKSGAYVIIEHTEALHVIDVNSGNRSKASSDQESNALDVNMNAAEEIAEQREQRGPAQAAEHGERREAAPAHAGNAGDERHERADEREETAQEHGQRTPLLDHLLSLLDALRSHGLDLAGFEDATAEEVADPVIALVADDRRAPDHRQ